MDETKRFVSIKRTKDVRLNNLKAAKDSITALKIFHNIRKIRTQKIELLNMLNQEAKELQLLFNKLYEFLPDHEILELKKAKKKNKIQTKNKQQTIKKDKNIDKLDKSLTMIEEKLKKIN